MRKKSFHRLKVVRIVLTFVFFTPLLLLFIDFADFLPNSLSKILHIQLIPAIIGGFVPLFVLHLLLTLFFGRIYCSTICPAGILQDFLNRLACIGKKKKRGAMRFRYRKPANGMRYTILGMTLLSVVFGFMEICLLLDPYSTFGRIATHLFRPIVIGINNLFSGILSSRGNYSLYYVSIDFSIVSFVTAIIALLVFIIMVYFRGRLYCNTICPVGSLLSIISRFSLRRITIDNNACNGCESCERSCKAEAIQSKNRLIDMSKCVTCFNCLSSCNKQAIKYSYHSIRSQRKKDALPLDTVTEITKQVTDGRNFSTNSRRSFLTASATLGSAIPLLASAVSPTHRKRFRFRYFLDTSNRIPVTPPGSFGIERFKNHCTGCHLCVVHCPSRVLKPAGLDYGWNYILKPFMSFDKSYCNYSCTVCSEVCPTHAIHPISVEQKKVTQVGIAKFHINKCIVKTNETDCGACSEHCSTQAVHMVPYKGTLTIPQIEEELCIGCGGCESICPVQPKRAIVVEANGVHQMAELPPAEDKRKIDTIDFGF